MCGSAGPHLFVILREPRRRSCGMFHTSAANEGSSRRGKRPARHEGLSVRTVDPSLRATRRSTGGGRRSASLRMTGRGWGGGGCPLALSTAPSDVPRLRLRLRPCPSFPFPRPHSRSRLSLRFQPLVPVPRSPFLAPRSSFLVPARRPLCPVPPHSRTHALTHSRTHALPSPNPTCSVRVRICSRMRSANSLRSTISCLRPAPRTRTAAVPSVASRPPMTAM